MLNYILLFMFFSIIIKGIRAIIYKIDVNSNFWYFGFTAQLAGIIAVILGTFGIYAVIWVNSINFTNLATTLLLAICLSTLYWYFTPIKKLRSRKDVENYQKKLYRRNLFSKEWIASGDWIQILVGITVILGVLYFMFSKD